MESLGQMTGVIVGIEYIRGVEEKRQNMAERLAKVEASAASAHHRLDDLQERVK